MIRLLSSLFIKNYKETGNPDVRLSYGTLCGAVGIFFNVILFAVKLIAGKITNSIAITADALNNLSDAGSSIITLVGFKLSSQKPDPEHPFGHGRFEYISGLIVSFLIIIMGFELFKSSLEKVLHPQNVEFSWISFMILVLSVLIKLYMFGYNTRVGMMIDSPSLKTTATDSVLDCISTGVVLICSLVSYKFGLNIDGWCGLLIAVFIFYSGIKAAKETITPLLGQPADEKTIQIIEDIVMSHEPICGIHDLIVNDYGPGRNIISLHAEVPNDVNISYIHDIIDNTEEELQKALGGIAVIHMDPIDMNDSAVLHTKLLISEKLKDLYDGISIHDFRMVSGETHTNLIFDAVVPYASGLSDDVAVKKIKQIVKDLNPNYNAVVKIDKSFTL